VSTVGTGAGESARLRRKLEVVVPVLFDAGRRLIEHPRIRDLYPEYLIASHGVIRASVPLMRTALERARTSAAGDPVAAGLASYLEAHVDEELDHDEWLLEDLEVLGRDRGEVLARPPSAAVAALVGAPYYWILHYHPAAVLGYIALLEGYPPTLTEVDRLMERTGYGREAFRTLIRHAELDPLHRDDLDEALDRLPLTREQSTVIAMTALHSVDAFTQLLEELVEQAPPG
jgi:hypothetical protein